MSKLVDVGHEMHALVDDEDFQNVSRYRWWLARRHRNFYAMGIVSGQRVYLHRFIMSPPEGMVVDHMNRNGLDCRRSNMRITSKTKNAQNTRHRSHNTSGFRGVYFCKQTGRWRAEIRCNGKVKKLGRYHDKVHAARVYDVNAVELHGEFATLNFPDFEWINFKRG